MTDKEFKSLNRPQLLDIIYQLQLQVDELTKQNQELEKALADKRLRIENAGNLAEAALEINNCFRSAQSAAEHYLNEIKAIREATEAERKQILLNAEVERKGILLEAEAERRRIIAEAETDADAILDDARKLHDEYDVAVEAIMKEFGHSYSNNG